MSAGLPAHSPGCFWPYADLKVACREAPGGSSRRAGQKLSKWTDSRCCTLDRQRLMESSTSALVLPHALQPRMLQQKPHIKPMYRLSQLAVVSNLGHCGV